MADLGTLRPGAANTTGLPTTGSIIGNPGGSTALSDDSDTTFDGQNTNSSGTYQHGRELGNTPSDFGTMATCLIQCRTAWEGTPTNSTWDDVAGRIMASNGSTVLAAADSGGTFQSMGNPPETTTYGLRPASPQAFSFVNTTADKTAWDGAIVQFQWIRTRNKGGDSLGCRISEGYVTGTYNVASTPFSADLTTASFSVTPQTLTRLNEYIGVLSAPAITFTPQALTRLTTVVNALTAPAFNFTAQSLTRLNAYIADLTTSVVNFVAHDITIPGGFSADLTAATFGFTSQALAWFQDWLTQLSTASFAVTAQALSWFQDWVTQLTSATFAITGQALDTAADYVITLSTPVYHFTANALAQFVDTSIDLSTAAFQYTAQALSWIQDTIMTLSVGAFNFVAQQLGYTEGGAGLYDAIYYHPFTRTCYRLWNRINGPGQGTN